MPVALLRQGHDINEPRGAIGAINRRVGNLYGLVDKLESRLDRCEDRLMRLEAAVAALGR